jgi:hypothetical protein
VKKKFALWKKVLLTLLAVILLIAATLTFLYRDMLFRDYENNDLAGSNDSKSFLFVGNSQVFWGKVPRQLYIILKKHGINITYKDISSNGAHLSRSKDEAIREIRSGKYDYVVFQDNTRLLPGDMDGFLNTIRILCDEAKEHGVIPVLYSPSSVNIERQPDSERHRINTDAYIRAADENGVLLVNAGDAWAYAYKTLTDISLYAWDGMHANNAGGFFTACVFAAMLFDLHVEEIPIDSRYKSKNASQLTQAAWEYMKGLDVPEQKAHVYIGTVGGQDK